MNTSLWYGGSAPHQPFHCSSPSPRRPGPEHVAAHHSGADILERLLHDLRALVHLAALLVMRLAPSGQRNGPIMQSLPTLAERVLLALVRAGDESVCRDRDVTPELAHRASSVGGRLDRGHRRIENSCGHGVYLPRS